MPLIYINLPENTISSGERDALAEEITTIALDSEHLPSTPFVRSTTWIYFKEYPSTHVYNGGKSGKTSIVSLEINAFEGGLNDEDKASLISRVTNAIGKYINSSSEVIPVYIIIRDVKDNNWGVFGDRITLDDLRNPPSNAQPV